MGTILSLYKATSFFRICPFKAYILFVMYQNRIDFIEIIFLRWLYNEPQKDFSTFSENIGFSKHFGIKNVKFEKKIRSEWFLENINWYRLFLQEITKFSEIPKNIIKGSISHSELNFCSTLTFLVPKLKLVFFK